MVKFVEEYPQCYSSDTATFLLKRIEYGCEGKGYESRILNEQRIDTEGCMKMSKLTRALMDAEDYAYNHQKRQENFAYAHQLLGGINQINPTRYMDEETVPMVYPRKSLHYHRQRLFFRQVYPPDMTALLQELLSGSKDIEFRMFAHHTDIENPILDSCHPILPTE